MTQAQLEMSDMEQDVNYKSSFLNLPNKTQYAGYRMEFKSTDMAFRGAIANKYVALQAERKAMLSTQGGSGTSGYALVPVYLDSKMIDTSRKQTPFYEIIPKVTNKGLTADYNILSAKTAASWLPEDSALTEASDTKARSSKAVKYLYAKGRVTGQAQVTIPAYTMAGFSDSGAGPSPFSDVEAPNATQQEVLIRGRAMIEALEDAIFNGSVSSNANQFDGIVQLQSTTGRLNKSSTALALPDIDTQIAVAINGGGLPKVAACGTAVYTDVLALLNAKVGYMTPNVQVFWGFTTIVLNTMAGQLPLIWSRFLTNVSGSKQLWLLDLDVIELRVLQDITYKPLAEVNDSTPFMLKWYGVLINRAVAFNAFVDAIL